MAESVDNSELLTVTQLTYQIKSSLEASFPSVWVTGEVSDVSHPRSGHIYLSLKDDKSQIRAVIWRSTASRLRFQVEDGMQLQCGGNLDVYPPRGGYQLVIRRAEPQGQGALQLALRQLQQRLAAEGLFDPDRKQPLPPFPRRIGFVTSPSGAAIHDFLEVLRRRWSGSEVYLIPARVQGQEAAAEIARGIELANVMRPPLDLLVVGRGGGSMEDLWCFNEEPVVRAIAASGLPVISAVGHEIDVTLADMAADRRALTPSEAAELVVPASEEMLKLVASLTARLAQALQNRATNARLRLSAVASQTAFRRPLQKIHELSRYVDDLEIRLGRSAELSQASARQAVSSLANQLESLSPLAVLGRGYSVTLLAESQETIQDVKSLSRGDRIETRLASGSVISHVESISKKRQ